MVEELILGESELRTNETLLEIPHLNIVVPEVHGAAHAEMPLADSPDLLPLPYLPFVGVFGINSLNPLRFYLVLRKYSTDAFKVGYLFFEIGLIFALRDYKRTPLF